MDPDIKILLSALVGAAIGLGIVFVARAHAETIDGDRIRIIDGDTVALPCDPARGIYPGCAERVRLVGIDAPETGTRTGVDRYGRTLARLTAGGIYVDAAMLAAGAAIPYAPGRAAWADRCRHWCPSAPRCEE